VAQEIHRAQIREPKFDPDINRLTSVPKVPAAYRILVQALASTDTGESLSFWNSGGKKREREITFNASIPQEIPKAKCFSHTPNGR